MLSPGFKSLIGFLLAVSWYAGCAAETSETPEDILDIARGAVVLRHTGQGLENCPEAYCYPVIATLDGTTDEYWASPVGRPYPHRWIIELDRTYQIETLAINNTGASEKRYPGVSAREVVFHGSSVSSSEGYQELARVEAKQGGRQEVQVAQPMPVRWLRVDVLSNHGEKNHTELMELEAYGKPVGLLPVQRDASGVYHTNYDMMKLQVDGNKVRGCYPGDGQIWGITDGRVFLLNWAHDDAEFFGTAVMVLASSGNYISGMWYEDLFKSIWFGNRMPDGVEANCRIDPAYPGKEVRFVRQQEKVHPLPTMQLKPR